LQQLLAFVKTCKLRCATHIFTSGFVYGLMEQLKIGGSVEEFVNFDDDMEVFDGFEPEEGAEARKQLREMGLGDLVDAHDANDDVIEETKKRRKCDRRPYFDKQGSMQSLGCIERLRCCKRFAGNAENFAFDGKNSAGLCGFYQEANYDDRFFPENLK